MHLLWRCIRKIAPRNDVCKFFQYGAKDSFKTVVYTYIRGQIGISVGPVRERSPSEKDTIMRKTIIASIAKPLLLAALLFAVSCSTATSPTTPTTKDTTSTKDTTKKTDTTKTVVTDSLAIYKRIYGATSVTAQGAFVVITSTGLPDHKSPYYQGTVWADSMYEAYNGTNPKYASAPGRIAASNMVFKIPFHPAEAATKQATPLGPIGISLNGVPFFNQYNGQGNPLTVEINSFDQWNGHPTPMNAYHYHAEPTWLTKNKGADALLGFLLDGFPVYGPMESGKTIANSDLDSYHGHFGPTADYPKGIYHYHITAADPYINGDGFFGTPGTVSH